MHARFVIPGGALCAAGLSAVASAGPVEVGQGMVNLQARQSNGAMVSMSESLAGPVSQLAHEGDGLRIAGAASQYTMRIELERDDSVTQWQYSHAEVSGEFTATEASYLRVKYDFGGWPIARFELFDETAGEAVFVRDGAVDPQASQTAMTLVPGSTYSFVAELGDTLGAAGSGDDAYVELRYGTDHFERHPRQTVVRAGEAVTLIADTDAPGVMYEWRRDDAPISIPQRDGADAQLAIERATYADAGAYQCVAIIDGAEFESAYAVLAVQPCLEGDANGDGAVDFTDLTGVLSQFGAGCE